MQEPSPATKKAPIAYETAFKTLFSLNSIRNQSSRKELFLENDFAGIILKLGRLSKNSEQ